MVDIWYDKNLNREVQTGIVLMVTLPFHHFPQSYAHVQRGLCITHPIYAGLTAGSIVLCSAIYIMSIQNQPPLIVCLHSYTKDPDTLQQLWLCAEWVSTVPVGMRFYIHERKVSWAYTIDPRLEPCPKYDHYA